MGDLHKQFIQLGREKNKILYKLLQILPEIYQAQIYKKYSETIEGYAWRFAHIPKSLVQKTLRLEKHLENKPYLKEAVAQVGVNKVAMIATLATPETDEVFADKVKYMSKPAIQELSKELRSKDNLFGTAECRAVATTIKIELDADMTFLFLKLKNKYGGNNQEVMKKILIAVNEEKPQKTPTNKQKVAVQKVSPGRVLEAPTTNRYISKYIKTEALKKSNNHCSYAGCNKPPTVFHHPERFSKTKTHENIKPLCKIHHEFMHNGIVQNEIQEPQKWKIQLVTNSRLSKIDQLYRQYKQAGGYA